MSSVFFALKVSLKMPSLMSSLKSNSSVTKSLTSVQVKFSMFPLPNSGP
eukprot:06269.XXX_286816_286962_1 [CDS] Oithona nana genome sequencing.